MFHCQLVPQKGDPLDVVVRQVAGLVLKNSMRRRAEAGASGIDDQTLKYMESVVLPLLSSNQVMLRRTAGSIVSTLVSVVGERTAAVWPHLLPALAQGLDNFSAPLIPQATILLTVHLVRFKNVRRCAPRTRRRSGTVGKAPQRSHSQVDGILSASDS